MTPLEAAASQLGVQEKTGNNDGVPAKRYMRGDELAWCAGFVSWCLDQGGDKRINPDDKTYYKTRAVTGFVARAKTLGLFRSGAGYEPKPGDIIFFGNGADSDVGRKGNHMGIVEAYDPLRAGRNIDTIEGNTSNKVARRSYHLGDARIIGFAAMSI